MDSDRDREGWRTTAYCAQCRTLQPIVAIVEAAENGYTDTTTKQYVRTGGSTAKVKLGCQDPHQRRVATIATSAANLDAIRAAQRGR